MDFMNTTFLLHVCLPMKYWSFQLEFFLIYVFESFSSVVMCILLINAKWKIDTPIWYKYTIVYYIRQIFMAMIISIH